MESKANSEPHCQLRAQEDGKEHAKTGEAKK